MTKEASAEQNCGSESFTSSDMDIWNSNESNEFHEQPISRKSHDILRRDSLIS
jgi:hypothetical protein